MAVGHMFLDGHLGRPSLPADQSQKCGQQPQTVPTLPETLLQQQGNEGAGRGHTETDTGMPVETSFCIAMLTLWLMPMSSVRMINRIAFVPAVELWPWTGPPKASINVKAPAIILRFIRLL